MYSIPVACFTVPIDTSPDESALETGLKQFEDLLYTGCDTQHWPWLLPRNVVDAVRRQALFLLTMIDVDGVGQAVATLSVDNCFTVQVIVQRVLRKE